MQGGGPGGWRIFDEPRIRFGEDIRAPDLAGWRIEHWTAPPENGPLEIIPDWVCEILSPSTEREDRTEKLPLYARARASHAWLINPQTNTLEVFRLEGARWVLASTFSGEALVRTEPFDAIEFDLSALWIPRDHDEDE